MINRINKVKRVLEMMYLKEGLSDDVVRLSQLLDNLIVEEQIRRLNYIKI
ncbi:Spo0E family sporulation regulatory protein-aspartic acid phosphatase [Romboutsia maritimum]|uniref:Spo0E family sporulation regulatory protein-aspartic acid phosphatase n=1 Tax=Romboutsia maritimum TaxID=2020948 RepID=A0A371ITF5_9FIRM|nr:Spo0E family sporulation regulatory protein-aspartic acid phosphatase [Romboutsia maritimum]RDY23767.1 Spo0E family sporulation regulatory protein-aspartic acid phosphatase [Romboutsia maritimum]